MSARAWYREPLAHFVVLGLALALGRHAFHAEATPRIVLGEELDAALEDEYRARHGEAPSAAALEAARDRWVRDEALYREALALGLGEGDAIVRRRLIQKMEFVLGASVASEPLTDIERRAYLEAHASDFELPERRVLDDRFFASTRADALEDARAADLDAPADPFLGSDGWSNISEAELARAVGADFARAVFTLPEGAWSDALRTREGVHRVRVAAIEPARLPELATVTARIDAALSAERSAAALERATAEIVSRYELVQ